MVALIAHIFNQALLISFLVGILMAWMVTFAVLACWSNRQQDYIAEELPSDEIPDYSLPLNVPLFPTSQGATDTRNQDSGEMGTVPVA